MLTRIRLRGYKSFADATLDGAGPMTVIFGPNDAGKSNLLDATALLSELAEVDSLKKAFDSRNHRGRILEAFHSPQGFGSGAMEELQERGFAELEIEVDIRLREGLVEELNDSLEERERIAGTKRPFTRVSETYLRYRLQLRYDYASGEPFVRDEALIPLTVAGEPKNPRARKPFIEYDGRRRRFVVRVERQSSPRYYDVNRNRTLLSEISDPVYHPHIIAAKQEIRSWRSYYVEPSLMRREIGVHGADDPGRHGEELAAFYWKLKHEHPARFRAVQLNLRSLIPSLQGIDIREVLGNLDPVIVKLGGGEFPFRLASEGTLRLLCLLGIAVAPHPPSVVAYEEPENGVQPSRLDILAHILRSTADKGRTQLIITSHSPTFLDRVRTARFFSCRRDDNGNSVFRPHDEKDKTFENDLQGDEAEIEGLTPLADRVARGAF